jgi:hypothetical protein
LLPGYPLKSLLIIIDRSFRPNGIFRPPTALGGLLSQVVADLFYASFPAFLTCRYEAAAEFASEFLYQSGINQGSIKDQSGKFFNPFVITNCSVQSIARGATVLKSGATAYILDLDSLIASRISLVVARVLIPGTSKGDLSFFLKVIENDSPPFLFIITSSVRAILSTSEKRCLASEYV